MQGNLTAALEREAPVEANPAAAEPAAAMAYLQDPDSIGAVRRCFADLGIVDNGIVHGGIDTVIEQLRHRPWPRFLIIDICGIEDPMPRINRLAEICDPGTEVVVIGDRNDLVLYRDLKAAGVAEYFFKPVIASLLTRTLAAISSGTHTVAASRGGRLVFVLGVRGGVGATTIATSLAWHLAEARDRKVMLLDLDLCSGDAALQFDVQPSHALREAFDDPKRIDDLFLERGAVSVGKRLSLLGGLEPLSDRPSPSEEAILQLLRKVLANFRYVLVDLPAEIAQAHPALLYLPSTLLLVSDGSIASIREVARWREFLGGNTPDRSLLHVLNKKGADGSLPEEQMLRAIPAPDHTIRWDRAVMAAGALGTAQVSQCGAIRDGIAALFQQLAGGTTVADRSLWKRIFG